MSTTLLELVFFALDEQFIGFQFVAIENKPAGNIPV